MWDQGGGWRPLTLGAVGLGLLLALFLLEFHVAEVQEGAHDLVAGTLLVHAEAQDVHGMLCRDRAISDVRAAKDPDIVPPPHAAAPRPRIHPWL